MEDKSKLHKGVGQIKEGMGKISEGVGNIVETKVEPNDPGGKIEVTGKPETIDKASRAFQQPDVNKSVGGTTVQPGVPRAFPGATPDPVEPKTGKAFTGFPAKENVITPPIDPMIEQARRVEAAHPAIADVPGKKQTQEEIEADRRDLAARQNINPKAPGPVSVTRPEWEEDKESPVKRATLQKPVVPGMTPMRANAPQEWRVGTMPDPEPNVEEAEKPVPDPKPVQHAANVDKGGGVTFIPKYKKFLAEFKASGQVYNAGMHDTEALALAAIANAKAHLYP